MKTLYYILIIPIVLLVFSNTVSAQVPTITSFSPMSGKVNSQITIIGSGFIGTNAVTFGGTAAKYFYVVNDTLVFATVDSGSTGSISITTGAGTATKGGFTFLPPPQIDSFTPTSGGYGTEVTIKGINFNSTVAVYFGTSQAGSFTILSDTEITAVVGNGSSGKVSIGAKNGSSSLPGFIYTGPVVTSFSPTTGVAGTKIVINGTNLQGTSTVSFGGVPAISFSIDSSTGISAIVGNGASGNITVSTALGTSSISGFKMVPIINSFAPSSGPIGTMVNINGENFDTSINNIVFLGAVQAKIISSTSNKIIVQVPAGATYQPISLYTNGLLAYSKEPFKVTYDSKNALLTHNSFGYLGDFILNEQGYNTSNTYLSDLDGDGKPDIILLRSVMLNSDNTAFTVVRNTSKDSNITFAPGINFGQFLQGALGLSASDINGDGKPDIIVASTYANTSYVSIYVNTSTPGNISFSNYTTRLLAPPYCGNVRVADFDGDGRPDIAVTGVNSSSYYLTPCVSVYINNSTSGTISFLPRVDFPGKTVNSSFAGYYIAVADLDKDGKPDIAVTNLLDSTLFVLQNTSTIGAVAFTPTKYYPVLSGTQTIIIGDLDGDNKPEIITGRDNRETFSVFKNTGTIGTISFAPRTDYSFHYNSYSDYLSQGAELGDLDGDGKLDIIELYKYGRTPTNTSYFNSAAFLKNISTDTSILFSPPVHYLTEGEEIVGVSIGDLNGDGKPDIVAANNGSTFGSVWVNKVGLPVPVQLCPLLGLQTFQTYLQGTNYQWQVDTGNGYINIENNTNYTGVNNTQLQLNNIPSSWYGYKYRCIVDNNNSDVYTLKFTDIWTGSIDSSWTNHFNWSCNTVPDANTDVIINSGTVVLNSNVTVRSLSVSPGASFTVNPPYNLTVTH